MVEVHGSAPFEQDLKRQNHSYNPLKSENTFWNFRMMLRDTLASFFRIVEQGSLAAGRA